MSEESLVEERWEGREKRNCGEHRTVGYRAWCFDCHEWCYPHDDMGCAGCEAPRRRDALERAEARVGELEAALRDREARLSSLLEKFKPAGQAGWNDVALRARLDEVQAWLAALSGEAPPQDAPPPEVTEQIHRDAKSMMEESEGVNRLLGALSHDWNDDENPTCRRCGARLDDGKRVTDSAVERCPAADPQGSAPAPQEEPHE